MYQALDQLGVRTLADAEKASRDRVVQQKIFDLAVEADYRRGPSGATSGTPTRPPIVGDAVLAGRGADLSCQIECWNPECLKRTIDGLFGRVWHYFDEIVVVGPDADRLEGAFSNRARNSESREVEYLILGYMSALLHLRSIGASDMIHFAQKYTAPAPSDPSRSRRKAPRRQSRQNDPFALWWQDVVNELAQDASIRKITRHAGSLSHFAFGHPWLTMDETIDFDADLTVDEMKSLGAGQVARRYLGHTMIDVRTADYFRCTLAPSSPMQSEILIAPHKATNPTEIALAMELPGLIGATAKDIVRVRKAEAESFLRFRDALRKAMKERAANTSETGKTAQEIADEIVDDLIRPQLNDIEQRLNKIRSSMFRKTAANVAVGTSMVLAGHLLETPLLLPAGIAAAAGSLLHYNKRVEERQEIELKDMYFLWSREAEARNKRS